MFVDGHDFYVYVADHPATGEPCYVGKGRGKRRNYHNSTALAGKHANKHLTRIIKKYGPLEFVIVRSNLSEQEAFETERSLISYFGRANSGNGTLSNQSDGGEGPSGFSHTAEWRAARSAATKGKPKGREHREKISAALKGRVYSPNSIAKMSAARKGIRFSDERRAAMRNGGTGKNQVGHSVTVETREKLRIWHIGRKASLETRAKMSASHRGLHLPRMGG